MSPDALNSLLSLCIGFALAGALTSGYQVLLQRPAGFGLLQEGVAPQTFAAVPFLDSTAANAMARVAAKAGRQGIKLFITGASPTVRRALLTHGVTPPHARYRETIARALADIKGSSVNPAAPAEDLAAS